MSEIIVLDSNLEIINPTDGLIIETSAQHTIRLALRNEWGVTKVTLREGSRSISAEMPSGTKVFENVREIPFNIFRSGGRAWLC